MLDDRIRVLICEDEPLILMATVAILEDAGMSTVEAGSAAEALRQLSESVDVLVTEIGLPDTSGFKLALEARKLWPALPIVFATRDRHVDGANELGNNIVLGKPYSDEEMIGAICGLACRGNT